MKKTMKAIIAIMLVALFAVAMIPAASAEDAPSLTIKNANADFSFDIYQIATLSSTTTGQYTFPEGLNADAKAAVNTAGQSRADFLAALDGITNLGINPVATVSGKTEGSYTRQYNTNVAGIYYARIKDQPAGNVSKVKNSTIVWPEYTASGWTNTSLTVDLATKVGTDRITKKFSDTDADSKCKGQGEEVEFKLTADIVGADNDNERAVKYQIWDKMCPGLAYVKGGDGKLAYTITYEDESDAKADFKDVVITEINDATDAKYNKGTQFVFEAKESALAGSATANTGFYSHSEVIITYKATVLNTAGIGKEFNPNKDGLVYRLQGQSNDVNRDGREVKVYTFSAEALKIDASATAKSSNGANVPLKDATIGLYSDEACTELIASGASGEDGKVVFKKDGDTNSIRLAPGTYYVKEISAPAGYALSSVTYPLTVDEANAAHGMNGDGIFNLDNSKVIENFATKLPETGGQGTLMFTLIGAGLILAAGVLFIIIMKKKAK